MDINNNVSWHHTTSWKMAIEIAEFTLGCEFRVIHELDSRVQSVIHELRSVYKTNSYCVLYYTTMSKLKRLTRLTNSLTEVTNVI